MALINVMLIFNISNMQAKEFSRKFRRRRLPSANEANCRQYWFRPFCCNWKY